MSSSVCVLRGYPVPNGAVVLNERLKGSKLHIELKDKVMVHIEGGIGCVDILLSPTTACLYIANNEVTLTQDTRSKLISLSKCDGMRGVVFVMCGSVQADLYPELQQVSSVELGLQTIPVSSPDQAAKYITQMVKRECEECIATPTPPPMDLSLFHTIQCLPRTGPVKAKQLLCHFHSLKKISESTVEELQEVVGVASARAIHEFFRQSLTESS